MLLGELNAGLGESTTPLIGWDGQKIHLDSLSQNNHVQVVKAVVVTQECFTETTYLKVLRSLSQSKLPNFHTPQRNAFQLAYLQNCKHFVKLP